MKITSLKENLKIVLDYKCNPDKALLEVLIGSYMLEKADLKDSNAVFIRQVANYVKEATPAQKSQNFEFLQNSEYSDYLPLIIARLLMCAGRPKERKQMERYIIDIVKKAVFEFYKDAVDAVFEAEKTLRESSDYQQEQAANRVRYDHTTTA